MDVVGHDDVPPDCCALAVCGFGCTDKCRMNRLICQDWTPLFCVERDEVERRRVCGVNLAETGRSIPDLSHVIPFGLVARLGGNTSLQCSARLYLASRAKRGMGIPALWAGCEVQPRATLGFAGYDLAYSAL